MELDRFHLCKILGPWCGVVWLAVGMEGGRDAHDGNRQLLHEGGLKAGTEIDHLDDDTAPLDALDQWIPLVSLLPLGDVAFYEYRLAAYSTVEDEIDAVPGV
ncbi:hypothetical protein NLJ89_g7271 [Agrocybe chaxingu]|uniref:Uncharacterized protein n=1 Tax=Agrocybe chaxingu TaxID=84603 RepID=A0A9W8JXP5_9AGAR|nr:hypothetical protein NLJ89_g7271 [Agrocybe chaxingu]